MSEEGQQPNRLCKAHSGFNARLEKIEDDTEKQWTVLDKLQNRPPVWATVVIALLTGLLGAAATYASLVAKIAQTGSP
jgi:hypothetical protein